jgi:hypothetical protein
MDSFSLLERRFSPITQYGHSVVQPNTVRLVPYDGTLYTSFLHERGVDYKSVRRFLRQNEIGSAFDLEDGEQVIVDGTGNYNSLNGSYTENFSLHPEA